MTTQTFNPVGIRRPRWAALRRAWGGLARHQWWWIGASWAAALALGAAGFYEYLAARGVHPTPWDLLYLSLQLVPLQSGAVEGPVPVMLEAARFLAPAVSAWAVLRALLHKLKQHDVPIIVRMADDVGLATLLQGVEGIAGFDSLRAFGLLSHTCRPELLLQQVDAATAPAYECPGRD